MLELVTQTALDATEAEVGRVSVRAASGAMEEQARPGSLKGALYEAKHAGKNRTVRAADVAAAPVGGG